MCFFIVGYCHKHLPGRFVHAPSGYLALVASVALHYAYALAPGAAVVELQHVRVVFLMYAANAAPLLRAFLESRVSVYLGKISFTVYIYHNVAQYVLFDYAYAGRTPDQIYSDSSACKRHGALTLMLSLCLGAALQPVEGYLNTQSKRFASYILLDAAVATADGELLEQARGATADSACVSEGAQVAVTEL